MDLWCQAGKDFAIELGVRLPGLACDDAAVANGLLGYKCAAGLLGFEADLFIARNALVFGEAGSSEHLDAMANGEDPLLLCIEFADKIEQTPIIAEVLRSAAAQNEDGIVITHVYLVE